jgi:hypothetical protein
MRAYRSSITTLQKQPTASALRNLLRPLLLANIAMASTVRAGEIPPADQAPLEVEVRKPTKSGNIFDSAVYFEYHSGQLAGMDNVILHPKYVLGGAEKMTFHYFPKWRNDFDLSIMFGDAQTGTGTLGQQLLEFHGHWQSLYTFYNKDDVLKFRSGLYSEFTVPFHHYVPYTDPTTSSGYAQEEKEILHNEKLFGADFDIDVIYDRLQSSFHNIIFFSGTRMGPNLLAYSPLLAFDLTTRAYLIGDSKTPRLDFYTHVQFWFARKGNSTSLFNSHDGLGGTKREIDLVYGMEYHLLRSTQSYMESYGNNNLNRGGDTSVPQDFRDGFLTGVRYEF